MAADDDDKPEGTPTPEPPKDPEPDPTPPQDSHHECKSLIGALNERITEMENTMKTVISIRPDTTPVKRPWTHRGLR